MLQYKGGVGTKDTAVKSVEIVFYFIIDNTLKNFFIFEVFTRR